MHIYTWLYIYVCKDFSVPLNQLVQLKLYTEVNFWNVSYPSYCCHAQNKKKSKCIITALIIGGCSDFVIRKKMPAIQFHYTLVCIDVMNWLYWSVSSHHPGNIHTWNSQGRLYKNHWNCKKTDYIYIICWNVVYLSVCIHLVPYNFLTNSETTL